MLRAPASSPAADPATQPLPAFPSFHYRNRSLGRRLASLGSWGLFSERGDRVRKPRGEPAQIQGKGSSGLCGVVERWCCVTEESPSLSWFWPRLLLLHEMLMNCVWFLSDDYLLCLHCAAFRVTAVILNAHSRRVTQGAGQLVGYQVP